MIASPQSSGPHPPACRAGTLDEGDAMRADYDSEADALYVQLTEGGVARSMELGDCVVIDLDDDGRARGVEIISPAHPFAGRLAEAARRFGIDAAAVTAAAVACIAAADRTVRIEVGAAREPRVLGDIRRISEDPS